MCRRRACSFAHRAGKLRPHWRYRKRNGRGAGGFTLLELLMAMVLGCMILTLCSRLLLFVFLQRTLLFATWESQSMWHDLVRVMRDDVHTAATITPIPGGLEVREADGTDYRYVLNRSSQVVRVRIGGGTVVLASHIRSFSVLLTGRSVKLKVTIGDGTVRAMTMTGQGDNNHVPAS